MGKVLLAPHAGLSGVRRTCRLHSHLLACAGTLPHVCDALKVTGPWLLPARNSCSTQQNPALEMIHVTNPALRSHLFTRIDRPHDHI